jgi:RNA polymerase-binding transcription factor DksA
LYYFVVKRTTTSRYTPEDRAEIIRLYKTGLSTKEIVSRISASGVGVVRIISQAGIYLSRRSVAKTSASAFRTDFKLQDVAWRRIESAWMIESCEVCGALFTSRGGAKICSNKCQQNSWRDSNPTKYRAICQRQLPKLQKKYRALRALELSKLAANHPKCQECQKPISMEKLSIKKTVSFCSTICRERNRRKRIGFAEMKKACYRKRQINGKNLAEKRLYYANNESAKIAKNIRTRLFLLVRKSGGKKHGATKALVGIEWDGLAAWLQSKFLPGMNWNNYGRWHIDHKIPCAAFDLTKPEEQKKCFHYTNLQPLWAFDNISKGDKILTV